MDMRRQCQIVGMLSKDYYEVHHSDDSGHNKDQEFVMEENNSDFEDRMKKY